MDSIIKSGLQDIAAQVAELRDDLERLMAKEAAYRDSIPEMLQGGMEYEESDCACSYMEEAIDTLWTALYNIQDAMA